MGDFAIGSRETLRDGQGLNEAIAQMAEAIGTAGRLDNLALVGIQRRGVPLAERLRGAMGPEAAERVPLGRLDITLYRDDLSSLGPQPIVGPTAIPFDVAGREIVLVDDVLFTGRTVRAALDALLAHGRPAAVRLAVLVDRGWRELPIQADVAGLRVETTLRQVVEVSLRETDGDDRIELCTRRQEGER